jgi:hypothetical protein
MVINPEVNLKHDLLATTDVQQVAIVDPVLHVELYDRSECSRTSTMQTFL